MNVKIYISYDGSQFNGSAKQPEKNTIQDSLEDALKVLNIYTKTNFSGRTDKYVHATQQIVSCQIPSFWKDLDRLTIILNKQIHNSIIIKRIKKVSNDFHARFSAKKRSYRYIISKKELTAFNHNYMHYIKNLDLNILKEASKYFIGVHDFAFFSKKGSEPKSTIREIYKIDMYDNEDIVVISITANSYLRSQIRMMLDFLFKIASNKLTICELENQLNKKELISWTLAPPQGLYLSKIFY